MVSAAKKAKLKWHCRRGMLELDLILMRFVEEQLEQLDEQQVTAFECLLNCSDPELYHWLMGQEIPRDKELSGIVKFIQLHSNLKKLC